MRRYRKYTDRLIQEAVANSTSIRQVLIKLDLVPKGGNYATLKRAINRLTIDTSHFTGQASNLGRKFGPKRPIEDYLENRVCIGSSKLKKRLLQEGIFDPRCSSCGRRTWLGKAIPLELDHINGNSEDNRLQNLRLLCPNCHADTPTYRGRNLNKHMAFSENGGVAEC